jgi:hypothetical protein
MGMLPKIRWEATHLGKACARKLTHIDTFEAFDKRQNIHIIALNLHFVNFLILLFCDIFFSFCVFYVFLGFWRK